jgi:hypothetical protein
MNNYNPDSEKKLWTTTKDKANKIGFFVFHTLGRTRSFYDWWSTLTIQEQIETRDRVIAIIKNVSNQ